MRKGFNNNNNNFEIMLRYSVVRLSRRLIHRMPMGDFFEVQCKFADVFNPLKLTDGEIGLLTGVIIMNAG